MAMMIDETRRRFLQTAAVIAGGAAATDPVAAHWHGNDGAIAVLREQTTDLSYGGSIRVRRGYLPDGGYLAIHDNAEVRDGDRDYGLIGLTDHIPAGDHWNIDVPVQVGWADDADGGERDVMAIPYRDPNTPYVVGWKGDPSFHTANDIATITHDGADPEPEPADDGYGSGGYGEDAYGDDSLGGDTLAHMDRHDLADPVTIDEFDGIDIVGLSPDDADPIGPAIERALAGGDTIVSLAPDTYHVADGFTIHGERNVGIIGNGSRFVYDSGLASYDVSFRDCRNVAIVGLTIDQSAHNTAAEWAVNVTGRSLMQDVHFVGHASPDGSGKAIGFNVRDSDGVLTFRRVTATDGTSMPHGDITDLKHRYNGGMWAGPPHTGTAYLIDCEIGEWVDNALYASRTNGGVVVDGGSYGNSSISQVRLGHPESFVGGDCEIIVDHPDLMFTRGIWLESGSLDNDGATVGSCSVRVGDYDGGFGGCINISSTADHANILGPVDIDAPDGTREIVNNADGVTFG